MADNTHIEWTDATWNPVTGCSVTSPGCTNCYAMKLAGTRLKHIPSRAGLTRESKAGPVWTGEVRFNEEWLTQPLKWQRPRRIFVCAHGDLFHENVPDEWIDRVFAVMALAPQHTFQVLTKRSARMREYLTRPTVEIRVGLEALGLAMEAYYRDRKSSLGKGVALMGADINPGALKAWPLPNVWLGVSVEDQARADERIPDLLATPAAVRWISAEPLLGPVDLVGIKSPQPGGRINAVHGYHLGEKCEKLDWVVCGGESGPGTRPMHPDWARDLRDQCAAAGVAFLFKQWGQWVACLYNDPAQHGPVGNIKGIGENQWMKRSGKKAAGRLLDGVLHDGFPA